MANIDYCAHAWFPPIEVLAGDLDERKEKMHCILEPLALSGARRIMLMAQQKIGIEPTALARTGT